jgi:hypothetical protein
MMMGGLKYYGRKYREIDIRIDFFLQMLYFLVSVKKYRNQVRESICSISILVRLPSLNNKSIEWRENLKIKIDWEIRWKIYMKFLIA